MMGSLYNSVTDLSKFGTKKILAIFESLCSI